MVLAALFANLIALRQVRASPMLTRLSRIRFHIMARETTNADMSVIVYACCSPCLHVTTPAMTLSFDVKYFTR